MVFSITGGLQKAAYTENIMYSLRKREKSRVFLLIIFIDCLLIDKIQALTPKSRV